MAKKVLSFILTAMLILSVLSVSAVEANPVTIYTDGFETGTVVDGDYTSDVWALSDAGAVTQTASNDTKRNASLAIVEEGTAPDTNKVLEVFRNEASGGFHLAMSNATVTIPEGKAVYAGFKARFKGSYPGTAKMWLVGVGRTPLIKLSPNWTGYAITDTQGPWHNLQENDDTKKQMSYNSWITVMVKITGTTAQAWVYDDNGVLLTTAQKTGTFKGYPSIFHPNEGGADNIKLYLDDSFYALVDEGNTIALQSSTLVDNATNVPVADQNIDLKFDMPVADLEDGDITCEGATVVSERILYDTVRVKLSGLTYEKDYALDFSKVKGMSGNALAGKNVISFTTMAKPANPATIYTDAFETGAVAADGTYTSAVWSITNSAASTSSAIVNANLAIIEQGTASNVNRVMEVSRVNPDGFHLSMTIENATIPESKAIYAAFKFTIPQYPGAAKQWLIGIGRNPLVKVQTGMESMSIVDTQGSWHTQNEVAATKQSVKYNSWNTVLMKITGTTAQAWVYNEAGNLILTTTEKTGTFKGYPSIFHPNEAGGTNVKLYIDDSMYALVGADNTVAMTTSSITANATNVELLDQKVDLKFDLPIADSAINGITLNGTAVTAQKVGYDTIRVTLPAVLAPNTSYTLDFANVTGMSGNSLYGTKSLTFTTKANTDDFIINNLDDLLTDDNCVPPAKRITVANVGAAKEDVDFIVAFYTSAGKLVGAQWVTDVDFGAQATATLQLVDDGYVYRNVYGIRVFAFSSDSELKPIFSGASYGDIWD